MCPRPDVLWILTTQWRAQACGFAGDAHAHTPSLDALAAASRVYRQAVTPHPFGPFARAALFTGVPSPANGVRDYFDALPIWREAGERAQHDPAGEPGWTIAHTLERMGYTTGFFGKWHLARRDPQAPLVGEAHARTIVPAEARGGFGFWEGFESGFLLNEPWLHGSELEQPRQFPGYQSDVVCERAARWIERATRDNGVGAGGPPWFCVVSLEAPHPPYHAPAAGVPPLDPAALVLPPNVPRRGEVERKARRELAGYYAHIAATDRAIGRLVNAVDTFARTPGRPGPIVVFTSVHGDLHGAHGLFRKGWPYEESVRVPLLVRLPPESGYRPAVDNESPVSLIDLPRWTRAWAAGGSGVELESPEMQHLSMPSVVPVAQQCDRAWRAVRTPTRKLCVNADGTPWLLFDLQSDPWEQRNLVHEPAWQSELAALRAHL